MNPKFSVGEVVILKSEDFPQYNGEYEVKGCAKEGDVYRGETVKTPVKNRWYYDLGFQTPMFNNFSLWNERCLRKKHQSGDMSFKELMSNLKTNIQERIS